MKYSQSVPSCLDSTNDPELMNYESHSTHIQFLCLMCFHLHSKDMPSRTIVWRSIPISIDSCDFEGLSHDGGIFLSLSLSPHQIPQSFTSYSLIPVLMRAQKGWVSFRGKHVCLVCPRLEPPRNFELKKNKKNHARRT